MYCRNLTSLSIPNNVTSIGQNAFYECEKLEQITLPSGLTNLEEGILWHCSSLKSVKIPNSVTTIGNNAFSGCNSLETISIPDGVTIINQHAFSECTNLITVKISSDSKLVTIGSGAFMRCSSLKNISLPDGVSKITNEAFSGCKGLETFKIPDGVTYIETGVFLECSNLNSVTIPITVTRIAQGAFSECTGLSDVYYSGSEAQWNQIEYANHSNNAPLVNATKHFNSSPDADHSITLSFDLNGGTGNFASKNYNMGTAITLPAETPQKADYIFTGWLWNSQTYQPGATLTADNHDMTFVAQWAEMRTIEIHLNGGTDIILNGDKEEHALAPHSRAVAKGSEFEIPNAIPTKGTMPFLGWTDGTNIYQPGDKFTVESSVQLKAIWSSKDVPAGAHKLTFNLNEGSAPEGWVDTLYFTADEGKSVRLPGSVPVKENFNFAGWSFEGTTYQAGGQFPAEERDVVLVAQWKSRFNRDELFTKSYSGNALKGAMCVPEGKNIDPALHTDFVSFLIGSSMGNTGSVQVAINQKIEKLLFSATYRPQSFGGISAIIQGYPRQNKDFWKTYRDVEDIGLDRTFKSDEIGAWGCASYAHCVSLYVYETRGSSSEGAGIKVPEDQIQTTFRQHLDPGESIAYNYGNGGVHWIAFLGESEDENGFYFLSYGGGIDTSVTDHKILLGYISYEDFASLAGDTISYWDTNGGSFYNKEIVEKKLDFNCPVEISVILGDESLSSKGIIGDVSSSFGRMTASGSSEDRHISVSLEPTTEDYYHVMVEGTGVGAMTLTLITIYTDGETDRRIYKNVPVSAATTMSTVLLDDGGTMDLCVDSGTNIQYWQTNFNGTAIEPSKGYYPYNPGLATPIQPNPPSSGQSGTSNPNTTTTPATYSIAIPEVTNGKVTATPTSASKGTTVTLTAIPNESCELATLTVTDSKGDELELTDKDGGKYTFTMPGSKVTVNAVFQLIPVQEETVPWINPFNDVARDTWYYDAVEFVSVNGLMHGISSTLFTPDANLTRAQLAQILYNKEGKPAVSGSSAFVDVDPDTWYSDAVTWAAANGIVGGYGDGRFGPNDNITREQLAVMLWRYAESPTAADKELHFTDADKASVYALEALRWTEENGIISGNGNGILDPKGFATRAQVAQMLKNYLNR